MLNSLIEREILNQLAKLAFEQQRLVLNFARALALATPIGTPGKDLLRFSGAIELDDLNLMTAAIKDSCEQVNKDEW